MASGTSPAFEASGEQRYVQRALQLADNMTRRQAAKAGGLVWEHYDENWEIDWDYNLDDPKHLFRPWGFQPGHQTEWAKLLLILDRHVQADWLVPTAQHLFDVAVARSWDDARGGLYYGFAPESRRQPGMDGAPIGGERSISDSEDGDALDRFVEEQRNPNLFSIYRLWPMLILELWLRARRAPPAPPRRAAAGSGSRT
jgi:hypothetical protein